MQLKRWQKPDLTGWSPVDHLSTLKDEIDQLFEAPFGDLLKPSRFFNSWAPTMDVYEDRETVTVRAEVPGMKKEDIEVSLHNGVLTISGERRSEEHSNAEPYRTERFFGRFSRSITLPSPVAVDKIKASYKDGILTVNLPKTEEAKPKQITVNVS